MCVKPLDLCVNFNTIILNFFFRSWEIYFFFLVSIEGKGPAQSDTERALKSEEFDSKFIHVSKFFSLMRQLFFPSDRLFSGSEYPGFIPNIPPLLPGSREISRVEQKSPGLLG